MSFEGSRFGIKGSVLRCNGAFEFAFLFIGDALLLGLFRRLLPRSFGQIDGIAEHAWHLDDGWACICNGVGLLQRLKK